MASLTECPFLKFEPAFFPRIWGGQKLATYFGMAAPQDESVGEAWLVSDHPAHQSVVAEGPRKGSTLAELLDEDSRALLGSRPSLDVHGRFPLLLKLLDARQKSSVQVHPGDEDARRLGEPDSGKTEMWYVLQADPGSEMVCGLVEGVTEELIRPAIEDGSIETLMKRFSVTSGVPIFVPPGTVHALGSGSVIAEIQQNSDITYRLYDYDRKDAQGNKRELHLEKALEVINFSCDHRGPNKPLWIEETDARRAFLAACRYFAVEMVDVAGHYKRETASASFYIVLPLDGGLNIRACGQELGIRPAEAVLMPGHVHEFILEGLAKCLIYYVPNLMRDVVEPLEAAGHPLEHILKLGGDPEHSDLRI